MKRWTWTIAAAALVLQTCLPLASGQPKLPEIEDRTRFNEIRSGTRAVSEANAAETQKNQTAIRNLAKYHVARLSYAAEQSLGSSEQFPISKVIREFSNDVFRPSTYAGKV